MTVGPTSDKSATDKLDFVLNGRPVSVAGVAVQTTLLDLLRERGLTGAKEGCAEGECGACMVALVTPCGNGSAYRAVNSCLMLAPMADGQEIYTVEGLAENGQLADAQKAMAAAGGSQCGYCTPGFVVSLFAEQHRPGRVGPCQTEALAGNLCRCTGYRPIADAAHSLSDPPEDEFRARLARPAPALAGVKYSTKDATFERPTSLAEGLAMAGGEVLARWVAGASDVAVESNIRHRRWPRLVSLEAIGELREFSDDEKSVRIGAGLPLSDLELRWEQAPQIVRQWFPLFASPAIRNRATLGGNLATASPIGDGAPMLLALDATLHLDGPRGKRWLPLSAFFLDYRRCAMEAGELIVTIEIPKPFPAFSRFYKVAKRRSDDISTVAAGFAMDFDERGNIARARLAYGGVAAIPLRAHAAEEAILGRKWTESAVQLAQSEVAKQLKPMSDHRGSAAYRYEVAQSLIEKFWWEGRTAAV